jgi:uridine kinase
MHTAADVIAAVRSLDQRRDGRTAWVGIDGRGASGKTTLADAIGQAVPSAVVVHGDDFAGPDIAEWEWSRFITQVRDPLLAGRAARYQSWDWDRDTGGPWHDIAPGALVVFEGVSVTRDEAGVPWDLRIWVEAPYDLRLRRAVERDGEQMLPRWLDDWMPSEERYIAAQRPDHRADLVVEGTTAFLGDDL